MKVQSLFLAGSLLFAVHAAHAMTRCDALPNAPVIGPVTIPGSIYPAQCNVAGALMRSGSAVPGGVMQFVDRWQGQCELFVGDRGTGQLKADTTCAPGIPRINQDGVWVCAQSQRTVIGPVPGSNQRLACLQALQVRIDSVRPGLAGGAVPNPPGSPPTQIMAAPPNQQVSDELVLHGPDVGAADSIAVTSDAGRNDARRNLRLPAVLNPYRNDQCLPPNCRLVQISLPPSTVTGFYTVTLTPPPPAQPGSTIIQVVPFVTQEPGRVMRHSTTSCKIGQTC